MKKLFLLPIFLVAAHVYAATPLQTLEFYKEQADKLSASSTRADRELSAALAENLGTWVRQNPSDTYAPQVLLSQARLYLQAQDKARALLALLTVKKLYPKTDLAAYKHMINQAVLALNEPAQQTAQRAFGMTELSFPTHTDQEADLLFTLSKLDGKTFYQPATALFEDFFAQNPAYEKNDQVELWYGDLHRVNGNYLAAIMQYEKAAKLYPQTPYSAASIRLIGDIYADNLKDTPRAMEMYTKVLHEYPSSNEIGIVYKHMAMLAENNKNFDEALINYEKSIELLGNTPAAYEAYLGKADVLLKTRQYEDAYNVYLQTANAYAQDSAKHTDALMAAAKVAKKQLRDNAKYAQALEKALLKYPQNSKAPQLMYDLGQLYEKQGKTAQAIQMYKRLVLAHPADKYANKAQGRLSRLEK